MHNYIERLISNTKSIFNNPINININNRRMRSESRKNSCKLLTILIQYLDLDSKEVKIPTSKGYLNLSMAFFSKKSNLSIHKCYRTVKILTDLNFIYKNSQNRFVVNVEKIM